MPAQTLSASSGTNSLMLGARSMGLVALALSAPALAQESPRPAKRSPRCHGRVTAEMRWQQREADAFTAGSLKAELVKRGLTEVSLPEADLGPAHEPVGVVLKDPDGVETVVTGHSETPADEIPPALFVEDKQHQLFLVDREPKMLVDKSYLICSCGPPGSGVYDPRSFGVRIPRGRSFKGHLPIAYPGKRVVIQWTDLMPDGAPCSKPP